MAMDTSKQDYSIKPGGFLLCQVRSLELSAAARVRDSQRIERRSKGVVSEISLISSTITSTALFMSWSGSSK